MFRIVVVLAVVLSFSQTFAASPTRATKTKTTPEAQATYDDVRKTLGIVPQFMRRLPEGAVAGAWDTLKKFEFEKTAIPGKYKSLISLGVAGQVPCHYCTLFDTEGAKLEGATEAEVAEAVTMAAIVRHWSTVLNGMQIDEAKFRTEVTQMLADRETSSTAGEGEENPTYREIAGTVGFVPEFMKQYPPEALPGAWAVFKNIQGNPKSRIPMKYKELLGLAVSAQVPCHYCTYYHTEAAKKHGATEREIREAVALAANVRQWSTFFHGMQIDETGFRKEVTQIMTHFKKAQRTASATPERETADDEDTASN